MGMAKILTMPSNLDTPKTLAWTLKEVHLFEKWRKANQLMFLNVNVWALIAQFFSSEVLTNLEVIVESRRNPLGYARADPKSLSLEHVIQCLENQQWAKRMTAPKSFYAGCNSSLTNNFTEYMHGGP
jgi:hypothetical protein